MAKILLVNPNLMKPPVTPVALDHLGQYLRGAGFEVEVLDLALEASPKEAIIRTLRDDWLLVAVSVRNVDDSFAASRDFCLERTRNLLELICDLASGPVVLGGCGFSLFPEAALDYCRVELGIVGEGEEPLARLARAVARDEPLPRVPGLIFRREHHTVFANPPFRHDLAALPTWQRDVVDNSRYLAEGGQVGFETKRGCPRACAYCADPVAKGTRQSLRTPRQVADELEGLARRGVDVFHTCDCEFNVPRDHALAICHELIRRRLGERIRWYAYCVPDTYDGELAEAMKRAGCAGIDFGADHADPRMLAALGRSHSPDDLRRVAQLCHYYDIPFMFDLLLGGPGESRQSIERTIEFMRELNPHRVGTSLGVRLYPGTPLVERLRARGPLVENTSIFGIEDNDSLLRPAYYIERSLGEDVDQFIRDLIAGDERFFFPTGEEGAENYNYNDNSLLCEAIRKGARGAYWDILRRVATAKGGSP